MDYPKQYSQDIYNLDDILEEKDWRLLLSFLRDGLMDNNQRRRVFAEASVHAHDSLLVAFINYCPEEDLDVFRTQVIKRKLWETAAAVLRRGATERQYKEAQQEVCKHGDESDIAKILCCCPDYILDSVLAQLVQVKRWRVIAVVIKRGVSETQQLWIVKSAIRCHEDRVLSSLLDSCCANISRTVLPQLVRSECWNAVEVALKHVSFTQRRWAIERGSRQATDGTFASYLLRYCDHDQLESVLVQAVARGMWQSVVGIVQRGVSDTQSRWALLEACEGAKEEYILIAILPLCVSDMLDSVLTLLVTRSLWEAVVEVLKRGVGDDQLLGALVQVAEKADDRVLRRIISTCRSNELYFHILIKAMMRGHPGVVLHIGELYELDSHLLEVFVGVSTLDFKNRDTDEGGTTPSDEIPLSTQLLELYEEIISFVTQNTKPDHYEHFNPLSMAGTARDWALRLEAAGQYQSVSICSFEQFATMYTMSRSGVRSDRILLMVLSVIPLFYELQNASLRVMLREKRWDVISSASLSHVWEHVRRELLQAAVEQSRWDVVKQWADHSMYDDQRHWAMEEAHKEKQWEVCMLLADHGLTEVELMRVYNRLGKYADWHTVLHLLERGADIREIKELTQGVMSRRIRSAHNSDSKWIERRQARLERLEQRLNQTFRSFGTALLKGKWHAVMHVIRRSPSKEVVDMTLKAATEKEVWHVVMQLVRLGMEASRRNSLFLEMVQRQQWGVCRVLLEHGVAAPLCLETLPELMRMRQWILVARVVEYNVDDTVRDQVMQTAVRGREGSLVWHCMRIMRSRLSVEERETLFQNAMSRENWQAVKPLLEEKDVTGRSHRDTAMQKATELRLWDLVDHCQRYHADINVQDTDGNTALNRAAMEEDWSAVKELAYRDSDQSLLDHQGSAVLHRAINAGRWDVVKFLIEFHGSLNQRDKAGETPLQMLIDRNQADIIHHSLLWSPDIHHGISRIGENPLHTACATGLWESMYYLVARGVNPLAVTKEGESVLMYAVQNLQCPQRMVAECIRLGFSTHQPQISDGGGWAVDRVGGDGLQKKVQAELESPFAHYAVLEVTATSYEENGVQRRHKKYSELVSPFEYCLVHELTTIMDMLYESGACSYKELFRLYTDISKGKSFCHGAVDLTHLKRTATTPRSLQSTCRIFISHSLNVRGKRHRDVQNLPVLSEAMKAYVMFSDLLHPDFGTETLKHQIVRRKPQPHTDGYLTNVRATVWNIGCFLFDLFRHFGRKRGHFDRVYCPRGFQPFRCTLALPHFANVKKFYLGQLFSQFTGKSAIYFD